MKYIEYFDIDPTYYPIIDPDSIKDPDIKWQSTYPHKTFIQVLETVERMLARDTVSDRHGIWIEGSYGTGKSRVLWTLQNILNCSESDLIEYFNSFDALRKKSDLLTKLLAHKEHKIITASRYGSGEITSIKQFVIAVFDSISTALSNAGVDYKKNKTLRGKIVEWLSDESHKSFFNLLIAKPEYRGFGSLSGKDADGIITQLNNTSSSADYLIDDILTIADNEGITAFNLDMEDLRTWIAEVIEENKIKAIILFWDEFSSFFKNNKTSLDTFQRLAELSESTSFHMIIATHMSHSLVNSTEDSAFKAVFDRFNHCSIEMPDNIAFELIHDAIKIKPAAKDEYLGLIEDLNAAMAEPRKAVCEKANIEEKILEGICPIHPMAALLLKNISEFFASNQRSMFNFIKNDDSDELHAFQWFIKNYSPDNEDVLTIDYLWNFFYEKGSDENTSTVGRSNLDISIATILDTYPANEQDLSREEKRVLKVILMLQAVSRKLNNAVELLRPTDKNIELAFKGDSSLDNHRATNLAKNVLVKRKILYIDSNGKVDEYAAAAVAGDQVQIDAIKERMKKETKTMALVTAGDFKSVFIFPEHLKMRFQFSEASVDNFTITINRIVNENKHNKFYAVICYARNEDEVTKIRGLISDAIKKPLYKDIIFIDASSNIMGVDLFDRFIDVAAQEEYWRPKDSKLADAKQKQKNEILGEWKNILSTGDFVVYNFEEKENCNSVQALHSNLSAIVLKEYPLSFDNAKVSENFFNSDKCNIGAKYGIGQNYGGIYQEKFISSILGKVLNVDKYWEVYPAEPISKLKVKIDKIIEDGFKSEARISIGDIFDSLLELGFYPCNLYAYLTGFLLKEYSSDSYRYGIGFSGDDGGKMSPDKLAEFIGEYVKHKNGNIKNYKEKYIEIMTKEQKAFVDFAHEVFDIPDNLSVEQTASKVRVKIKDEIGYPLWCFEYIDTNNLGDLLDNLATIANPKEGSSVPGTASQFGAKLIALTTATSNLKSLLTAENGTKAMQEFLGIFEDGELLEIAERNSIPNVMNEVRKQVGYGEASWLWDKETGIEELKKLLLDYKIIDQSNRINNTKATSFFYCIQDWKNFANFIKLPHSICRDKLPELKVFIDCLKIMVSTSDLPYDKRNAFLNDITSNSELICDLSNKVKSIVEREYSIYLNGFNDNEYNKLFSRLPNNSFLSDPSGFEKLIKQEAENIRSEQLKFQLLELWKNVSGTNSPAEWSEKNQTPIIILVPAEDREKVTQYFNTINSANAEKNDCINNALEYLQGNPSFLKDLNDKKRIDTLFTEIIIGKYSSVLSDVESVRNHLESYLTVPCYSWYNSRQVNDEIQKMARSKYLDGGNTLLLNRIDHMSADEAKALLRKLVNDSVDVGISIMLHEGETS